MVMQRDMWATALPCELLLQIFRRLGSTALIRSTGVCKPWRRAIIDNASCLHPLPDRFLPDLLQGFYYTSKRNWRLEYEPAAGPSENVPAMDAVDVSPYHKLLASRDGFLFLGENTVSSNNLCLFSPLTGSRRLLPAAAFDAHQLCNYILVTGYDDDSLPDADSTDGSSAVRILAVVVEDNGITYRILTSTSGGASAWGPVKHSAKILEEGLQASRVGTDPNKHVVVCGGSVVYWLVMVSTIDGRRTCLFAMDTRTERTWTTELPEERDTSNHLMMYQVVVVTSEDGRQLSLIMPKKHSCEVEVWVLDGDSRWMLQRTMDIESLLLPNCSMSLECILMCRFCPRSGRLIGIAKDDQHYYHFLVGLDGSSPRLIETAETKCWYMLPYEMGWSTYISKMKYF